MIIVEGFDCNKEEKKGKKKRWLEISATEGNQEGEVELVSERKKRGENAKLQWLEKFVIRRIRERKELQFAVEGFRLRRKLKRKVRLC